MVALSNFVQRGRRSVHSRVEQHTYRRRQDAAWRDLRQTGGNPAVAALEAGFELADRYRVWDNWSLDRTSIIWLADLVTRQKLTSIIEFGAGYSTLALTKYLTQILPETKLMSFEHQPDYARHIRKFLPPGSPVQVECSDLGQVNDMTFEQLFEVNDPTMIFQATAAQVPTDHAHETRLHNVFYRYDFRNIAAGTVDLIILDGPNGNGRSLAFPFLRHALRFPGWLLVDDYQDYPFLEYCQRIFKIKMVQHFEGRGKEFVLVSVAGLR